MDNGFFGKLFDLNHDGKLDALEQYIDYAVFEEVFLKDDSDTEDDGDTEDDDN